MATFPTLRSGVVTQYPLGAFIRQAVQVIRFVDGSTQRFLGQGKPFRSWKIRLDLLSDSEIASLETFFAAQQGTYGRFTFPDPISNEDVANCRLGIGELNLDFSGTDMNTTALWVIETNG